MSLTRPSQWFRERMRTVRRTIALTRGLLFSHVQRTSAAPSSGGYKSLGNWEWLKLTPPCRTGYTRANLLLQPYTYHQVSTLNILFKPLFIRHPSLSLRYNNMRRKAMSAKAARGPPSLLSLKDKVILPNNRTEKKPFIEKKPFTASWQTKNILRYSERA